tara:strand:+ start:615 stop:857 length:243 start_codon:yes stop_codon:yes gene_type:complete
MTNFYTKLPNSQVVRSKIDVLTIENPDDEELHYRVEITCDNDGVFLTSCCGRVREDVSISTKELSIAVAYAILEAYEQVQ